MVIELVPTWLTENHTSKMPLGKWRYKRNGRFWSCSKILTSGASQWPTLSQQLSAKGMHFALPLAVGEQNGCLWEHDNASHLPHSDAGARRMSVFRSGRICISPYDLHWSWLKGRDTAKDSSSKQRWYLPNIILKESESEICSVVSDSLRPHGLDSPWNSPAQNTGVGSPSFLKGLFPTQISHIVGGLFTSETQGKPKNIRVGSLSLLQCIFLTQESNWGLLHCRWILYPLSYQAVVE